eukprot:tig00020830_g14399.t1
MADRAELEAAGKRKGVKKTSQKAGHEGNVARGRLATNRDPNLGEGQSPGFATVHHGNEEWKGEEDDADVEPALGDELTEEDLKEEERIEMSTGDIETS